MEMAQNTFRNTKKVIPKLGDFGFNFYDTIMIFEARFRQNGTLLLKCFFSGIYKYLNGHVLCLQED